MNPIPFNIRALAFCTVLTSLLQGCASTGPVTASYTAPTQRPSFELVDQRPGSERISQWLTNDRDSRSCTWGVRQIGDEAISPDRMSLLRDGLDARLHQELTGKTLLVTHYAIYINDSHRNRRGSPIFNTPALQSWIETAVDSHRDHSCKAEEVAGGWLESGEHPAPTPVIVEISLSLDGNIHHVRKLFSPDESITADPIDLETADWIVTAVRAATDQLVTLWHTG